MLTFLLRCIRVVFDGVEGGGSKLYYSVARCTFFYFPSVKYTQDT